MEKQHLSIDWLGLRASPPAGRRARKFAENLGKVALIVESQIQGDTKDRRVGIFQQLLCAFNPPLHDKSVRRLAGRLLELPHELYSAQASHLAQLR